MRRTMPAEDVPGEVRFWVGLSLYLASAGALDVLLGEIFKLFGG